jgi:hypothetical protein
MNGKYRTHILSYMNKNPPQTKFDNFKFCRPRPMQLATDLIADTKTKNKSNRFYTQLLNTNSNHISADCELQDYPSHRRKRSRIIIHCDHLWVKNNLNYTLKFQIFCNKEH